MIVVRERFARLTPRERRFVAAGAIALLLFALYWLWPAGEKSDVELATTPPPPVQPVFVAPVPPPPPPSPPAPAPPAADASALAGLTLRGVMGGGPSGGAAIVAANGAERVVRVGRELIPGVILREVGIRHAIASSPGGDIRLELNKTGGTILSAAAPGAPAMALNAPPTPHREALQYRLGLAPQKVDGRIRGFAIRPTARLPMLERAGLRPGDILVSVNGQAVESEEKVIELPQEIAGAYTAEFEFIRGGKRMKASLDVNKRP